MEKKSLTKNTIFNVLYQITTLLFPLVYSVYVARIIQAENIGKVVFTNNVVSYFTMFAVFGTPVYATREISKVRNNKILTNQVFTELFCINFITTLISIFSFCIFIFFFVGKNNPDLILYFCCSIPLILNFLNIDWLYKGNEEYKYIVIRNLFVKFTMIILLFIFIQRPEDYLKYALINGIATSGNYIFNIIHSRKYAKLNFSKILIKRHIKIISIFFLGDAIASIYNKVDVLMLGLLCNEEIVGYYEYAHKTILLIITICNAFSLAFLPRLSYCYEYDKEAFINLINKGIKILLYITIPMTLGTYLLSPYIIPMLYGYNFNSSVLTIRIFSILIFVRGLGDLVCYQLLMSTGKERIRMFVAAFASLINVFLNFIFIPRFQQNGAAIASVISEIFLNTIQCIYTWRIFKYSFPKSLFINILFSTIIMSLCIKVIIILFNNIILIVIFGFLIGVISFIITSLLLKNEVTLLVCNKILQKVKNDRN